MPIGGVGWRVKRLDDAGSGFACSVFFEERSEIIPASGYGENDPPRWKRDSSSARGASATWPENRPRSRRARDLSSTQNRPEQKHRDPPFPFGPPRAVARNLPRWACSAPSNGPPRVKRRCEIRQEERASDGLCHGARESNLEAILGLLQIQEPYRPMADFRPAFEPAETRIRRPAPRRPCAGRTSSTSALFLCRGPRPGDLLICAAPPRSRPPHPARCSLCACV